MKSRHLPTRITMCLLLVVSMVFVKFINVEAYDYSETKWVEISSSGQVVDSITVNGKTVYAVFRPYDDTNDTDAYYSCEAFVKRFYSEVYDVDVYNLKNISSIPKDLDEIGIFYEVFTPQVGDIVRDNKYDCWAIVKEVRSNNDAVIIQQNVWGYNHTTAQVGTIVKAGDTSVTYFRYMNNAGAIYREIYSDEITDNNATIHGTLSSSKNLTEAGFYISTDSSMVNSVKKTEYISNNNSTGYIRYNMQKWNISLNPCTTYFFQLYTVVDGKEVLSDINSFTTTDSSVSALCASGHTYNSGIVTKPATCASEGIKTYTCEVCTATRTESIEKGSTHSYDNGIVTKGSTCTQAGEKTYTCTVCGITKTEYLPKNPHIFFTMYFKQATCVEEGRHNAYCKWCNYSVNEIIPKLSTHTFSDEWKKDTDYHWHECSVEGCGEADERAAHTAGEWIVDKEATLQSEGLRHKECSACGYVMITETIPKLVHTTDAIITDAGLFTVENTREHIVMGIVTTASENTDIEYRGSIRDSLGNTKVVKDWTLNNEWLDIVPDTFGEYTLIAEARVVGNPASSKTVEEVIYFNPYIKGKCQLPYGMVVPGLPGYLIGVETYENPNQEYQYEMLILDCTLLAQGKDAWVYTTNKFTVADGAAGWCVWQPKYGYYWTLFRVYDAEGNMIDQACYPFVNAY